MPTAAPLIAKRVLAEAANRSPAIEPTALHLAASWARTAADPAFQLQTEKSQQGKFLADIFGRLLGYRQFVEAADGAYTMRAESASKQTRGNQTPDAILGHLGGDAAAELIAAVVELKAPNANLDARQHRTSDKRTPVEQAFGYVSKFPGCRWVIVSNFRTLRLYRTTRGEGYAYEVDLADLRHEGKLREFIAVLRVERLLSAAGESATAQLVEQSISVERKLADGFYNFYRDTRRRLFTDLLAANPPSAETALFDPRAHERQLLRDTQTVLDRLIFIAFAEDTGLLPRNVLAAAVAEAGTGFVVTTRWQQLLGLFRAVDAGLPARKINAYNGGLFAAEPRIQRLTVPDAALGFLAQLSDYDFSEELGVEVLGRVFERSIVDLEDLHRQIDSGTAAEGAQARSKRSQDGVFYTPEWVTRFVVERTLGAYLHEREELARERSGLDALRSNAAADRRTSTETAFWRTYQDELQRVRILDPACGSGAFLVAALNYLLAEHRRVREALVGLGSGTGSLFSPTREILRDNLYGVDVNSESVEITRLSLWLQTAHPDQSLTSLDATIRVGDSLIAPPGPGASANYRSAFAALSPELRDRAFDWRQTFAGVFDAGTERGRSGFDVVIGNPPYVRGEWLAEDVKAVLAADYAVYTGKADLLTYFYERSVGLLAAGGHHGFIVSNKWLRAGYGEPLRRYLSEVTDLKALIDFGHSPVFEDADAFPIITLLRSRGATPRGGAEVKLARVPRESLGAAGLAQLVEERAFRVAPERFGAEAWSLEPPEVQALLERLTVDFQTLADGAFAKTYYGVKTGYNDAFIVDRATRDRLVAEDARSAEIIQPFLRGTDIKRWHAPAGEEFLLFSYRGIDIESYPAIRAHLVKFRERLTPKPKAWEPSASQQRWPGRKGGKYAWYELQDTVDYHQLFAGPKILFTDIAWQPELARDTSGAYLNNSAYFLPGDDPWLVALLNAPLTWWVAWRTFQHGKDDVLRWYGNAVEGLPYAPPPPGAGPEVEVAVSRLEALAAESAQRTARLLHWLATEYGVATPGKALADPLALDRETFLEEVRKRGKSKRLGLEAHAALADAYATQRGIDELASAERRALELRLAALVEDAFGLSAAERRLLKETAVPRMGVGFK